MSWILVIMLWNNNGPAVTVAPGLYASEGLCSIAAGKFNDGTDVMRGVNAAAFCIPGPTLVLQNNK